jgi:hypothetical protein
MDKTDSLNEEAYLELRKELLELKLKKNKNQGDKLHIQKLQQTLDTLP